MPPGIRRDQDPTQPQLTEANEQSLSMTLTGMSPGEAKCIYKNTTLDLRQYRRMQMYVHANALENDVTNLGDDQLALFVRLGSDYKSNYYEYEVPLKLTPGGRLYDKYLLADCEAVWPQENMVDIPLTVFTKLKKERNQAKANGLASYNRAYSAYDASQPKNKVTIMGNPTLGEVKTVVIGVRNLASQNKSGEVWINELRLKEYENSGGWAAQGNLNVQLSDFGSVNVQGRYVSQGFGGLEQGVAERTTDDTGNYTVTTNFDLGKFFPDKAKVSVPLYYSVTKEKISPKYNPLDSDMLLDDALESAGSKQERDSIESIAVTKTTQTNFSLSNVRVGIQNKRHPMPYDPANFSFSYSHSHNHTTGETTVYENEDNWRGSMNYAWTPVYKAWEPFKKIKSKSKWYDILKKFGLNWLPQTVGFNTDITRSYYELQERDMESTEGNQLPQTFSEQFLWNRDFNIRWDLTKNLHASFQSATHAEIEEPYTPINKDLYPDRYQAWKDSVKTSLRHFGKPLNYNQSFQASYQLPLNLLPIFSWVNADMSYNATYQWVRGTDLEDGTSLGNTISNNRNLNINSTLNLEKLYNMVPFLKATNDKFNKEPSRNELNKRRQDKAKAKEAEKRKKAQEAKAKAEGGEGNGAEDAKDKADEKADKKAQKQKDQLPKNKKTYEKEVKLMPDTTITVQHGKNTKRLIVTAKTEDGKTFELKYKKTDANKIVITNKVDSALSVKISVTPKEPLENKGWYKTAQAMARVLMMVRSVGISYRNQYAMTLPGFMPNIGDAFGQT